MVRCHEQESGYAGNSLDRVSRGVDTRRRAGRLLVTGKSQKWANLLFRVKKELEVKLICKDGPVFCSRRMLGFSKWFHEQINCREQYGNQLEFNYENYSRSAVKLFTDSLHLLQSGPSDIPVIVECIDFLQFEGKPKSSVFEKMMIERLLTPIIRAAELPLGSELLICLYLSKVDDFENNLFLRNLTDKLTEEKIGSLLFKFDATDELNMSMIKMCVSKQLLDDSKNDSCLYSLMQYGKQLLEERNIEDFLPDPRSVRLEEVPQSSSKNTLASKLSISISFWYQVADNWVITFNLRH